MPVDRSLAEGLAQNLADLYRDAEARLAANLARQVRSNIQNNRLTAITTLRRQAEQVLQALQGPTRQLAERALMEAYAKGASAAVNEMAQLAGKTRIVDSIARLVGYSKRRDPDLVDAVAQLRFDLPGVDALMALAQELSQRLSSTHLHVLRWQQDAYREVMAQPAADVLLGLKTRLRASQVAWEHLLSKGIAGFTDRRGRNWELSSYVEMATRTTVAHAAVEGALDRFRQNGIDLVIVSNAPQECKRCRPWEGKILAISGPPGSRQVEHGIEDRMVSVDVVATIGTAVAAGLMHPNCRHSLAAYIPGVTRVPTNTADPKGDEDRQRLRELERRLRKAKRREAAVIDPSAKPAASKKVRALQAQIRDHVKNTSAKRQPHREQIDGPAGGHLPALPPTATAPTDTAPTATAAPAASDRTRALIDRARAELPTDIEGWDAPVTEIGATRAEIRLAEEREALAQAQAAHRDRVAEIEDEFRRKRTPHARRRRILEERTEDTRAEIRAREMYIESIEKYVGLTPEEITDENRSWLWRETSIVYPTDANGRKLPPDQYERWLDTVMAVGEALHSDIETALASDEEYQRLRAVIDSGDYSGNDARALARLTSETTRSVLASIRDLGGQEQTLGTATEGTRSDWRELIREAEQIYPTDWLRLADARGPLHARDTDRAYFSAHGHHGDDLMAFDTDNYQFGTAFSSGAAETTAHETGHRMESAIPGLTHLEFTMVRRRAMQDGVLAAPEQLKKLVHEGYGDTEIAYEDQWPVAYMGKTYAEHREHPASVPGELFTVSVQSLFGRSPTYDAGPVGHRFALGVLATLGGRTD
jgi:hypothetical protein